MPPRTAAVASGFTPVSLNLNTSRELKLTLAPYIALNFLPTHKRDYGDDSGIHALMTSFNAARRELDIRGKPPKDTDEDQFNYSQDTTLEQWKGWFENKRTFKIELEQFMDNDPYWKTQKNGFNKSIAYTDAFKAFTNGKDLIQEQMCVLLKMANDVYGEFVW